MSFEIKFLSNRRNPIRFAGRGILIGLSFLYIYAVPAWGAEKSAQVNFEVLPHRWSAVKLSNVDRGATLRVKLNVDGQATVVLVNSSQFKNYPRVTRPLFRMETRNRAHFSIVATKKDDYYLIVDNRKGAATRKYSLSITARLNLPRSPAPSQGSLTGDGPLELLSRVIQTAFDVKPLLFKLASCGEDSPFIRGETVYLCTGYLKRLKRRYEDKRKVNDIVLFELVREAGQVLLNRWNYPLNINGKVKDEFATVLMVMFDRRQAVEIQVTYLKRLGPEGVRRSRIISKWLEDPFIVKKWQPFLIPKMQTAYLRILKKEGHSWASRKLIDRELAQRPSYRKSKAHR